MLGSDRISPRVIGERRVFGFPSRAVLRSALTQLGALVDYAPGWETAAASLLGDNVSRLRMGISPSRTREALSRIGGRIVRREVVLGKESLSSLRGRMEQALEEVHQVLTPDWWDERGPVGDEIVSEVVRGHPQGLTLKEIGQLMRCTRQRVEQIEKIALRKLHKKVLKEDADALGLKAFLQAIR